MWFRTQRGRLLYGEGGLAQVYRDRGYTVVDGDEAPQLRVELEQAGGLTDEERALVDQALVDEAGVDPNDLYPDPDPVQGGEGDDGVGDPV